MTKQKTAVAYARFSSDLQRDRSIDDQIGLCEQIARREGYKIVRSIRTGRSQVPARSSAMVARDDAGGEGAELRCDHC